jgi:hypothetical protein
MSDGEEDLLDLHSAVQVQEWDAFMARLATEEGKAEARQRDDAGCLIFHHVELYTAPANIVRAAVEAFPQGLMQADSSGDYPIFFAIESEAGRDSDIIRIMLEAQPNQAKLGQDAGFLPLHALYDVDLYLDPTVEENRKATALLLLEAFPGAVNEQGKLSDVHHLLFLAMQNSTVGYGSMEVLINSTNNHFIHQYDHILHDLCAHHDLCDDIDKKVQLILEVWPEAAGTRKAAGGDWQLPINVLAQGYHSPDESVFENAIILLASSYPAGLMRADEDGVLPFTRLTTNYCPSRVLWNIMYQLCPEALYTVSERCHSEDDITPLTNVMSHPQFTDARTDAEKEEDPDTVGLTFRQARLPNKILNMRCVESYALQTTFRAVLMSERRGVCIPEYTGSESSLQQLCYLAHFAKRKIFHGLLCGIFSRGASDSNITAATYLQSLMGARDDNYNSPLHILCAAPQLVASPPAPILQHASTLQACLDCQDPSDLSHLGIFVTLVLLNGNPNASSNVNAPLAVIPKKTANSILRGMAMEQNTRGELPIHVLLKNKSKHVRSGSTCTPQRQGEGVCGVTSDMTTIMERCADAALLVSLDTQSSAVFDPIERLYPFMYAACGVGTGSTVDLNVNRPCLSLTYTLLKMFVEVRDITYV